MNDEIRIFLKISFAFVFGPNTSDDKQFLDECNSTLEFLVTRSRKTWTFWSFVTVMQPFCL